MLLITRKSMESRIAKSVSLGLLVGGLTLAATWSGSGPSVLAQESLQAQQLRPVKIARTLPGSRTGMLTEAKGGTVLIDRGRYVLAPDALIEDRAGNPLLLRDLTWNDVELPVRYWLGTGGAQNLITQMIVTLAE
jgi:hypothetical protein